MPTISQMLVEVLGHRLTVFGNQDIVIMFYPHQNIEIRRSSRWYFHISYQLYIYL